MPDTRFKMPSEPKNGLDLLRWLIFEPVLLDRFSKKLTKKESRRWFLRAYSWIILFSCLIWMVGILCVVGFDIPSRIPQAYEADFIKQWHQYSDIISRIYFILKYKLPETIDIPGFELLFGLFFGLTLGSSGGLNSGLFFGLYFGLLFGFSGGLSSGLLATDFGFGLWFGLYLGIFFDFFGGSDIARLRDKLVVGLLWGLFYGLFFGLFSGLIGWWTSGGFDFEFTFVLVFGFGFGIGAGIGITFVNAFFTYFRIIIYPAHVLRSLFPVTFEHNPYRKDGIIWRPIWLTDQKLLLLAKQQPDIAFDFANFLLEYRPLQEKLAMRLLHVATAGNWDQQASSLNADVLFPPAIPEKQEQFYPSERWIALLERVRQRLITSQTQTQIGFKKGSFEQFVKRLEAFRTQTLRESRVWNQDYLEAIDKWIEVATEKLEALKQQAETYEPITTNIYRSGEALRPETDKPIFVGRDDLKKTLSSEIRTARQMPMFLIQGQRRVGKTSLLNFLPELLGPRFKIVYQDLQGLPERNLGGWLKALKRAVDRSLKDSRSLANSRSLLNPPDDWLLAWSEFREYLEQISKKQDYKLILAFDEYEILHDDIFQKDPEKAHQLLGMMRSFSQHQNQVVFLFVGAKFFSELQNPNWNEYFVQVKHLRVDYLKWEDTLKLVQHPVPDFNLIYPDDLANRIFDLTQGHPALIQQICSEMVNFANHNNRKNMGHDDLDTVLDKKILHRENVTIQIFWTQFCTEEDRKTIEQILANQSPMDKVSLYRLKQHGYIVRDGETCKIRVPLFETWLRKFVETFE